MNAEGHHQPNKYESCHFGPSTRPKNRFQYSMAHPGNHTVNTKRNHTKLLCHFETEWTVASYLRADNERGSVKITSTVAEGFAFWCFDGYFCSCPKSIYPKGGINVRGKRPRLQISIIWTPLFTQCGKAQKNVSFFSSKPSKLILISKILRPTNRPKNQSEIHSRNTII